MGETTDKKKTPSQSKPTRGGGNDGGGNDGGGGAATDGGRGERVNASPAPQFLRHSLLVLLGDKNSP
jgi:hypothetical protein